MDEQRELAEIERRLASDDPVLAARLTAFRLPRLSLAPRSARSRLVASLLMLGVVAVVSVFVYTLMPFRAHTARDIPAHTTSAPATPNMSAAGPGRSSANMMPGNMARPPAKSISQAAGRSGSAVISGH
jgi:hypothetical protein